jgi:hypothetical protein
MALPDLIHVFNAAWRTRSSRPHTECFLETGLNLFERNNDETPMGIGADRNFLARLEQIAESIRDIQREVRVDFAYDHLYRSDVFVPLIQSRNYTFAPISRRH